MDEDNFYFKNTQGPHSKFWAVLITRTKDGKYELTRRWGKIGDDGQSMSEVFAMDYEAVSKRSKLIAEKINKGYLAVL